MTTAGVPPNRPIALPHWREDRRERGQGRGEKPPSPALGSSLSLLPSPLSGNKDAFQGFDWVSDVGVSGLTSSYYTPTRGGDLLPDVMPEYGGSSGHQRILYPYGIGPVPSPGGYDPAASRIFDEGALGTKVVGSDLIVRVAGGLDPRMGYYYPGWQTWYGQGDMFLTVQDRLGLRHYALLNYWPRDGQGGLRRLDSGAFDAAQAYHVPQAGPTLEGHLVRLLCDSDVASVGGRGSYYPAYIPPPDGLDYRVFAQGGWDLGDAGLTLSTTRDSGYRNVMQDWYIQTWTVPIDWLSTEQWFTLGLHKAASCGNDQIGLLADFSRPQPVAGHTPAPSAIVLAVTGLIVLALLYGLRRTIRARRAARRTERQADEFPSGRHRRHRRWTHWASR